MLLISLLFSIWAYAEEGTGLGVILGAPTGASVRHWLAEDRSVDGGIGWSLGSDSKVYIHADHLWSKKGMMKIGDIDFDPFFGIGLSLRNHSGRGNGELVFGPRVPVGVSYHFGDPKLELFAQFAMSLGIIPSSAVYVDAGIGGRFYF